MYIAPRKSNPYLMNTTHEARERYAQKCKVIAKARVARDDFALITFATFVCAFVFFLFVF